MRADFLLDYDVLTVAHQRKLYLMARLVAGPAPETTTRRPLNLSLVIDRSGSMSGLKIDYTRQAAKMLVQNLSAADRLSIVLYNEKVETLLQSQLITHKDRISQQIDQIRSMGTTNLSGGWLEGLKHVRQHINPEHVNRVILMTDGLANRGITDPQRLKMMGSQQYHNGISTTTMGLGETFNEDLLVELADASGGAFYFIESPESAPEIFSEELRGLLSVVGQNVTVTVEPTEHIAALRQLNTYPTEKIGPQTQFRLGDAYGEETKTLMLELDIPALQEIGNIQIATLHFAYDELQAEGYEHRTVDVPVIINISENALPDSPGNAEVTRSVLLLKAAAARREAIDLADKHRYEEASKRLKTAADEIASAPIQDEQLDEERDALREQAQGMNRGHDFYAGYSRKSMVTQVYFTGRGDHDNTQSLRRRETRKKSSGPAGQPPNMPDSPSPAANRTGIDPRMRKTGHFDIPAPSEDGTPNPPPTPDTTTVPTQMRWGEHVFTLQGELMRIGRAQQNEIMLDTAGISRFHAQLTRQGKQWVLEDLNSTNGTHVRGERLARPYTIRTNDTVYFCDQRVTFE